MSCGWDRQGGWKRRRRGRAAPRRPALYARTMNRRAFLASGAALAASPTAAAADRADRVQFLSDGLSLTPIEYSRLLARLVEEHNIQPDSYSLGGVVEKLEA